MIGNQQRRNQKRRNKGALASVLPVALAQYQRPKKKQNQFLGPQNPRPRFSRNQRGYVRDLKKLLPKGSASAAGSALGGLIAGPGGALVGSRLGSAFSRLTGVGDYTMGGGGSGLAPQAPIMQSGLPHSFTRKSENVVVHREFVQDVVEPANNGGSFTLRSLDLNAGNPILFPWFSNNAALYDQYRVRSMSFMYKGTSSSLNNAAGAGVGLGVVVISTDYDSADEPPANKQQMEAMQYTTSCVPYASMLHGIECKRSLTVLPTLYVRSGQVPIGKDVRLYDLGRTFIATQGIGNNAAPQTLGELWVSYEIELLKPILNPGVLPSINTVGYRLNLNAATAGGPANYLGDHSAGNVLDPGRFVGTVVLGYLPGFIVSFEGQTGGANPTTIRIQNGNNTPITLMAIYSAVGVSTALSAGMTAVLGGAVVAYPYVGSLSTMQAIAGVTAIDQYIIRWFTIAANGLCTITYGAGTLPVGMTNLTWTLLPSV